MGYFSNGSEGADYQATWCDNCAHDDQDGGWFCPIWTMQLEWNPPSQEDSDRKNALERFIPRVGIWNGACTMFASNDAEWVGREDELRDAWNKRMEG